MPYQIQPRKKPSTKENTVHIGRDIAHKDARIISQKLRELVDFRGYSQIFIDFSNTEVCFPETILPIISSVLQFQTEGVRFVISPPSERKTLRTFLSSNWLHLMDPSCFKKHDGSGRDVFPATVFKDSSDQFNSVNYIMDRILRTIDFLDRDQLRALEWSLNEIIDNVLIHADSETGGIVQLTHMRRSRELEFVVCDSGIGIANTLRRDLKVNWTDEYALEKSVEEGITRGTGQGNGLFGSIRIAEESGGAFSINSGHGFLSLSRNGKLKLSKDSLAFPGTSVQCNISYQRPLVLENALNFKGRPHRPFDYIDRRYEEDENILKYQLSDEAVSLGSRGSGHEARTKLENLIARGTFDACEIICDQSRIMSSSFADEFFVKLLAKFGRSGFFKFFTISGISNTNFNIISRSCFQRLSFPFEPE